MQQIYSQVLLTESEFQSEVSLNTSALAIDMETFRIVYATPEAERMFQCRIKNGLSDMPFERLIPSELREKHSRHVAMYLKDPHPRMMGQTQIKLRALGLDGESFPVAISLRPIKKLDRLYVILTFMPLPKEGADHAE